MPTIREMTPDSKSAFRSLIRDDTAAKPDHWVFLLYDQLNLELIPFNSEAPHNVGIILIESLTKGKRRPYHKQKLAVLLSNLRHFALEAQAVGHPVLYVTTEGTIGMPWKHFPIEELSISFDLLKEKLVWN